MGSGVETIYRVSWTKTRLINRNASHRQKMHVISNIYSIKYKEALPYVYYELKITILEIKKEFIKINKQEKSSILIKRVYCNK